MISTYSLFGQGADIKIETRNARSKTIRILSITNANNMELPFKVGDKIDKNQLTEFADKNNLRIQQKDTAKVWIRTK